MKLFRSIARRAALTTFLSTLATVPATAASFDGPSAVDGVVYKVLSPELAPTMTIGGALHVKPMASEAPDALYVDLATSELGRDAGRFELAFDAEPAAASHFDGRLLTADDLKRDQVYRMAADWPLATGYQFVLYDGDAVVAIFDAKDGVAPFVVERLPDDVGSEPRAGSGGTIEIYSFSWSVSQTGASYDYDRIGVLVSTTHAPSAIDVDATTITMAGVEVMSVQVVGGERVSDEDASIDAMDGDIFEVELGDGASTPRSSGYLRVMKLNTGG